MHASDQCMLLCLPAPLTTREQPHARPKHSCQFTVKDDPCVTLNGNRDNTFYPWEALDSTTDKMYRGADTRKEEKHKYEFYSTFTDPTTGKSITRTSLYDQLQLHNALTRISGRQNKHVASSWPAMSLQNTAKFD